MHSVKAISVFHSAPSTSRLGLGKRERDTARATDPKQPKRYSTPYGIMLGKKTGRFFFPKQLLLRD